MDQLVEFASNNGLLASALIATALAVIFNELRLRNQGLSSISTGDAVRLINQGAVVVDVREKSSFNSAHIVDSRCMSTDELLAGAAAKLKKKKAVLLVCDSGTQSARAAAALRKSGIENVFSLKGGIAAWRQENFPVVNNAPGS